MKTFKEYILEIFDNTYDYNIYKFNRPDTFAYFVTKEEKLFSVKIFGEQTIDGYVSVLGFTNYKNWIDDIEQRFGNPPFSEKDIRDYIDWFEGTDKKQDVNTPDTIRIFATVIKIAEDYYKEFEPDVLIFKAKNSEANRVSLYTMIAKKFAKKYEKEVDLEIISNKKHTTFKLIKI